MALPTSALTPFTCASGGLNHELNRAPFGFSTAGGTLFASIASWSSFDASKTIDIGTRMPERRDEPLCEVDIGGETPPKCKRVGAKSAPTLATEFLRPLTFLPPASAAVTLVVLLSLFVVVFFFMLFLLPRVVVVVAPFVFVRSRTPIVSFANETSLSPALCDATIDFSRNGNCLFDAVAPTAVVAAALVLYIELRCENILPWIVFIAAFGDVCLNADPREPIDGNVGRFFIVDPVGGFKFDAGVLPNRMVAALALFLPLLFFIVVVLFAVLRLPFFVVAMLGFVRKNTSGGDTNMDDPPGGVHMAGKSAVLINSPSTLRPFINVESPPNVLCSC